MRHPLSSASTSIITATALAILATVAGCTTTRDIDVPDVYVPFDVGPYDGGADARFPDPTIDPCMDPGGTIGEACTTDEQCSDGCYCNGRESCGAGGTCVAGADPCVDSVDCTDEACLEETDTCFHMPNHAMCSDMLACNGYEQCDRLLGCVPGAPLYCNDESSCTVDACSDTEGCVYTPRDLDGDGFVSGSCGGEDCDDDPRYGTMIYPGAVEVCDNRRDDDCDGRRDFTDSDCAPMNDTCELATILPARSGTYSGSTAGLTSNYVLGCGPGSGPDAVFRFTLTEPHDVRLAVSGVASATIVLRPFAMCATGPDEKCASGAAPSVLRRSLPAGDWAIIVRSTGGGGPFDLSMMITDPTPVPLVDRCNAMTETIVAPGGTVRGRFEEVGDDYTLSCHSGSFRDAAYRFTITEPQDVFITGSTTGGPFGTPTTYVSLLTDCSNPMTTQICQAQTSINIRRRSLPAGTYYILIESSAADAVEWSITVNIMPPAARAPGDACTTAVPITLADAGGGRYVGTGMADLVTAELDSGTSCGGGTGTSRDLFFYFDIPATGPSGGPRDITLTTNGAGFHYVSLQTACGVTGSDLRCRTGSGAFAQSWRSLAPGRYYVTVATTLSAGTVTAEIDSRPGTPVPPNDRCSGAIVLTNGASRRDTLIGFEDDLAGCTGSGYPDAFYTFTLAARQRVIVSVDAGPTTARRVYLTLRSSCSAGANLQCVNGDPTATINTVLDPGTYSLFVEQTATTASDFNISYIELPP